LRNQSNRSSIVGVSRSPARTKSAISAAVDAAATAQMRLTPTPNSLFLYAVLGMLLKTRLV
jgi:hypothetical protein